MFIKNLLFFFAFLAIPPIILANDLHIDSYKKDITVFDSVSGYTSHINVSGRSVKNKKISIYFNQLEKITDLAIFYNNVKGKQKRVKKQDIYESGVFTSSFYDGYRYKYFYIPATNNFEYEYSVECNELMFLNNLDFSYNADSISYTLSIPNEYAFIYNLNDIDTSVTISIDSLKKGNSWQYTFQCSKKHLSDNAEEKKHFLVDYESIPREKKIMRILVVSKSYIKNPYQYLNNWYLNLIDTSLILNSATKNIIDSITHRFSEVDSIVETLVSYIQSKIKYIDIENGINGYRPRNVNQTLYNKQGDCKDMASLLCAALNYKGIDANMALVSTQKHAFDIDFPNAVSANHAICITRVKNKLLFLDPTEFYGLYNLPSMGIQGRHAFLVSGNGGQLIFINTVDTSINRSAFNCDLYLQNDFLEGSFNYSFCGLSSYIFRFQNKWNSKSTFEHFINNFLKEKFHNLEVNNLKTEFTDSAFKISGNMKTLPGVINNIADKKFISLNFTLFPHNYTQQKDSLSELYLQRSINNVFNYTIHCQEPGKMKNIEPILLNKDGFSYENRVKQKSNGTIIIFEKYQYGYSKVHPNQTNTYNSLNKIIAKSKKNAIILN